MSKEIERLADRLAENTELCGGLLRCPWHEEVVRTVLQAMREPSDEALRRAVKSGLYDARYEGADDAVARHWQAMIDHILSE